MLQIKLYKEISGINIHVYEIISTSLLYLASANLLERVLWHKAFSDLLQTESLY